MRLSLPDGDVVFRPPVFEDALAELRRAGLRFDRDSKAWIPGPGFYGIRERTGAEEAASRLARALSGRVDAELVARLVGLWEKGPGEEHGVEEARLVVPQGSSRGIPVARARGSPHAMAWLVGLAERRLGGPRVSYVEKVFAGVRMEEREVSVTAARFYWGEAALAPFLLAFLEKTAPDSPQVRALVGGARSRPPEWEEDAGSSESDVAAPSRPSGGEVPPLRPYQEEALESWLEAGGLGGIVLPTGAGKTRVGLAAMARLGVPTLVLVPTIELARQWRDNITRLLGVPGDEVGVLGGGLQETGRPILVSTFDSLLKRPWLASVYGFLLVDEAHHIGAPGFRYIAWSHAGRYRMALSATLERGDGADSLVEAVMGSVVYRRSYQELVRGGFVSPVRVFLVPVPMPPDLAGEVRALRREMRTLADECDLGVRKACSEVKRLKNRLNGLEKTNPQKVTVAASLVGDLAARGARVMVFAERLEQARALHEALSKALGGEVVRLLTGQTPRRARVEAFEAFRGGRARVLVTTRVLDEGVDAPSADAAVIVSGAASRNPRQTIQRIGRILRPGAGKEATAFFIYTMGSHEERGLAEGLLPALVETYGREAVSTYQPPAPEGIRGRAGLPAP